MAVQLIGKEKNELKTAKNFEKTKTMNSTFRVNLISMNTTGHGLQNLRKRSINLSWITLKIQTR